MLQLVAESWARRFPSERRQAEAYRTLGDPERLSIGGGLPGGAVGECKASHECLLEI